MPGAIVNGSGAHDVSSTTLVNEAGMKLSSANGLSPVDHLHFLRIVAQPMRYILVDATRRRSSKARGSDSISLSFDESLHAGCVFHLGPELLDLNAASGILVAHSPRQLSSLAGRKEIMAQPPCMPYRATPLFKGGRLKEAEGELRKTYQWFSDDPAIRPHTLETCRDLAVTEERVGRPQAAMRIREELRTMPNDRQKRDTATTFYPSLQSVT